MTSNSAPHPPFDLPFLLPPGSSLEPNPPCAPGLQNATFLRFADPATALPVGLGAITGLKRYLATARINPWSLAPHFGTALAAVPDETMMLLWEKETGGYGVDFFKVDNQGSLDHFLDATTTAPTATMQRYQEAFQSAAAHHFQSETLHCLSQTGDVFFHLDSGNVMRNSEDYFPKRAETQGQHVFRNALNNVFMAPFCVPDWDMFQSSREPAPFHAAARAICGGPLYISDKPGEQNFALLRKLITTDGRALRCPQPARPTKDCLFIDAYQEPHLFKIQNSNGSVGVLGLFNCHWDADGGQTVTGNYSAADVDGLAGDRFALYHHTTGALRVATRAESFDATLPPLGWELVTIAPIEHGVAVLGLADKLNGSAAITTQRWLTPNRLEITLREGGPLALHLEREPTSATVGGTAITLTHTASGATIAELPVVADVMLSLEFAA